MTGQHVFFHKEPSIQQGGRMERGGASRQAEEEGGRGLRYFDGAWDGIGC